MVAGVIGALIFIGIYLQGKKMCSYKDFFHVRIPKILQKFYYVQYDCERIPLQVAIAQPICLLAVATLLISLVYSIFTGIDTSDFYQIVSGLCLLIMIPIAIYAAICDLFLRILRKKE